MIKSFKSNSMKNLQTPNKLSNDNQLNTHKNFLPYIKERNQLGNLLDQDQKINIDSKYRTIIEKKVKNEQIKQQEHCISKKSLSVYLMGYLDQFQNNDQNQFNKNKYEQYLNQFYQIPFESQASNDSILINNDRWKSKNIYEKFQNNHNQLNTKHYNRRSNSYSFLCQSRQQLQKEDSNPQLGLYNPDISQIYPNQIVYSFSKSENVKKPVRLSTIPDFDAYQTYSRLKNMNKIRGFSKYVGRQEQNNNDKDKIKLQKKDKLKDFFESYEQRCLQEMKIAEVQNKFKSQKSNLQINLTSSMQPTPQNQLHQKQDHILKKYLSQESIQILSKYY